MNDKIKSILISEKASIIDAIRQMDTARRKLLIVIDENSKFFGLISIGDIQRAIIKNIDTATAVKGILRQNIKVSYVGYDRETLKTVILANKREFEPIIDSQKNIIDVLFWEDLFQGKKVSEKSDLALPVVIMAGGQGSRLRPLTNVLPKPLIPLGEQTILEDIMDRFVDCGCSNFYMSVNYKADFLKLYFDSIATKKYDIEYFQEEKPLGTAGSLHLLGEKIDRTFFVSNCDIIIDEDYAQIYNYHKANKNELTCVAAIKHYEIPYGTMETTDGGILTSIIEKPTFTFKINTGLYILEPHLLNEIPKNEFYHITFLIDKLIKEGRKVGVFPINEGSWTDIGNWDEYIKTFSK